MQRVLRPLIDEADLILHALQSQSSFITSSIDSAEMLKDLDSATLMQAGNDFNTYMQRVEKALDEHMTFMKDNLIPMLRKFDQDSLPLLARRAMLPHDQLMHRELVDKAAEIKESYTTLKQRRGYLETLLHKLRSVKNDSCLESIMDLTQQVAALIITIERYETMISECNNLFNDPSFTTDLTNLEVASQSVEQARKDLVVRMDTSMNISFTTTAVKALKSMEEAYDKAREKVESNTVFATKLKPLLETIKKTGMELQTEQARLSAMSVDLFNVCGEKYRARLETMFNQIKIKDKAAEATMVNNSVHLDDLLITTREPFMYLWLLNSGYYKSSNPDTADHYKKHMVVLEQLVHKSIQACSSVTGSYQLNIRRFLRKRKDDGIGSKTYQDDLPRMSCAIQALLRDMQQRGISNKTLDMMQHGITSVLTPHVMLSDSSVEGVTWNVGFNGDPDVALLKYGVNKEDSPYLPGSVVYKPDFSVNLIHEIVVGSFMNTLSNLTPNFMYYYGGFVCSVPLSSDPDVTSVKTNYNFDDLCSTVSSANSTVVAMFELVPKAITFRSFVSDVFIATTQATYRDFVQVLAQIFASIDIAYHKLGFIHGDMHGGNILVTKLDHPVSIKYTLSNGQTIELTNVNYLVKIIDYGFSTIIDPATNERLRPMRYEHDSKSKYFDVHMYQNALLANTDFKPQFLDIARVFETMMYRFNEAAMANTGVPNHRNFVGKLVYTFRAQFPTFVTSNKLGFFQDDIKDLCDETKSAQRARSCDDTDTTLATHWKRIEQGLNTLTAKNRSTGVITTYTSIRDLIVNQLHDMEPFAFMISAP